MKDFNYWLQTAEVSQPKTPCDHQLSEKAAPLFAVDRVVSSAELNKAFEPMFADQEDPSVDDTQWLPAEHEAVNLGVDIRSLVTLDPEAGCAVSAAKLNIRSRCAVVTSSPQQDIEYSEPPDPNDWSPIGDSRLEISSEDLTTATLVNFDSYLEPQAAKRREVIAIEVGTPPTGKILTCKGENY